jgi:hypothetical protein
MRGASGGAGSAWGVGIDALWNTGFRSFKTIYSAKSKFVLYTLQSTMTRTIDSLRAIMALNGAGRRVGALHIAAMILAPRNRRKQNFSP